MKKSKHYKRKELSKREDSKNFAYKNNSKSTNEYKCFKDNKSVMKDSKCSKDKDFNRKKEINKFVYKDNRKSIKDSNSYFSNKELNKNEDSNRHNRNKLSNNEK